MDSHRKQIMFSMIDCVLYQSSSHYRNEYLHKFVEFLDKNREQSRHLIVHLFYKNNQFDYYDHSRMLS